MYKESLYKMWAFVKQLDIAIKFQGTIVHVTIVNTNSYIVCKLAVNLFWQMNFFLDAAKN